MTTQSEPRHAWRDWAFPSWRAGAQEVRHAFRRLLREPGFVVPVVGTLSIGIGVTTAVFTLVNAVLIRPLPYTNADQLVVIRHSATKASLPANGISAGLFAFYQSNSRTLDAIGLYSEEAVTLTDLDTPQQVHMAEVTPALLNVLRPAVFVDRWLPPGNYDASRFHGALISYRLWTTRYGSDPALIGRTIELGQRRIPVDGVLAPGFGFPREDTDVWDAITLSADDVSRARLHDLSYDAVARLRRGRSPADAERDLNRLANSIPDAFGDVAAREAEEMGLRASVVPLKDAVVGDTRVPLLLLLGTTVFLLLITWANVSNLALVRAIRLRPTIALIRALGADEARVAYRFLIESLLLATISAAIGLWLAVMAIQLRFGFSAEAIPRLRDVRADGTTVGIAIGLAVASGLVLGGIAWLAIFRPDVARGLSGSGRATTGRGDHAVGRVLVIGQVALALALMIGSALMAESFWRLSRVQLGFRPQNAVTFSVPISVFAVARNDASELPFLYSRVARVDEELLTGLRALPGVQVAEAGSASGFPLTPNGSSDEWRLVVADRMDGPDTTGIYGQRSFATPGYFSAMGIPVLRGRTFRYEDTGVMGHGVILSASLAKALFRGIDPVGRRVRRASRSSTTEFVVVGVVGDVLSDAIRDGPTKGLYLPNVYPPKSDSITTLVHSAIPNDEMFIVRTDRSVAALLPAIQRTVHGVNPKFLVTQVGTLDQRISEAMTRTRLTMLLLLVASAVALVLGVVGIYGILSYLVSQRTNELGIRMALGQSPADVLKMVVWQGAQLALTGVVLGMLAAFGLTGYLRSLLYGVSPSDPAAYLAMAALLAVVACAACLIPAWRASRIDTVKALRGH